MPALSTVTVIHAPRLLTGSRLLRGASGAQFGPRVRLKRLPVLEPNPMDGHRKLLRMLAVIAGILGAIAIGAVIAARMA
ncbi:SGM_5486 family transporter-associated protein [Streptomyces sp. WM6378]|uniref:SGM_5486 family transporter-associated protein n=1 Tax=Streptomyces sp. WM6378 TaxID=1415557 RepID=UPI000A422B97